ncbi:MAG: voltage-gated potassium channel [Pseudomonadota bacterium]|nr:voltage-gated potassium channel [Pseudomonadota bacterium]
MSSIFFIVLRRMRAPLIVLIVIYAVSVLGLTLVPGVDANGQPAPPLSFFHAFYFISYTATTIGFGEIPNAFSDAQRLWVTVCIYLTVIGWSYSIVTLLALFQDKAFQSVLVVGRFARRVRHLHEPFYLVCGCGETGALVCRTLDELNIRFVVVEAREERVQELDLEDFKTDVPALAADAQAPKVLQMAGLLHPKCLGVLALTNDDNVNLAIAISTRLLNPGLTVLARAENPMTAANMASFGTHHIINPFERFADYLGLALEAPHTIRLLEWVTGLPGRQKPPMHRPPSGAWVVCGHGRFSRPVVRELAEHDLQVTVITPEAMDAIAPPLRNVIGLGVRAETLCEADVAEAVGLVAGTDNDVNNLSIAVTAKAMNPDLFVVLRQNRITNASLFEAYGAQFTMVPSRIIAHESMAMIITPLLARFLDGVRGRDDDWAAACCARMEAQFGDEMPQVWSVRIDDQEAPALTAHLKDGGAELSITTRGFELNNECLDALPLMLVGSDRVSLSLFPAGNMPLHCGDELLFAGRGRARDSQRTLLSNANILAYLLTGRERPGGWIWQEYGKKLD